MFIGGLLIDRNIEPFDAKRDRRKHKVMVNIKVVGLILIDVNFKLGNLIFDFGD